MIDIDYNDIIYYGIYILIENNFGKDWIFNYFYIMMCTWMLIVKKDSKGICDR